MEEDVKGYLVQLSYDRDFVNLMNRLARKYPQELFEIQGISNKSLDINAFSKSFFRKSASNAAVASVSVDPNANIGEKTIAQWTHEHPKGIARINSMFLIWRYVQEIFSKKDADECVEAVMNGRIFVNDGHQFERPYCFGFDLAPLCSDGLKFFKGSMNIGAPKRADSFIALLIQATAYLSNQIAGATSFPTLFVNFDWYLQRDHGKDYIQKLKDPKHPEGYAIRNLFQNLIYSWGFPFRGAQSPFTNVSVLDRGFLNALFGLNEYGAPKYTNPDGTAPDLDSIYELQKQFYEYFDSIFGKEGVFTFPVVTLAASIDEDKNYLDPDFIDWITKVYPNKCVANIYIGQPNSFSSCCRMKNDYERMEGFVKEYQNSFGVGGISIGSTRVCGINFPAMAYKMKEEGHEDFKPYLDKYLPMVHKVLYAHRMLIEDSIERGVLPLYDTGWIDLGKQYSTVGVIGAYEFLDALGKDILTDEGSDLLVSVFQEIEERTNQFGREYKVPTNIEQIPGESMGHRLSKIDRILGRNGDYETELYSNQYVPLVCDRASIYDRIKIQGKFDQLTSGGSILHLNIDDSCDISSKQIRRMIEAAKEANCVYFAINRVFVKCEHDHVEISNNGSCPVCGGKIVNNYTRIVGFITPIQTWSPPRAREYRKRVFYSGSDRFFAKA
jgi:ribonucleoside-triphosphate reductase (formate)